MRGRLPIGSGSQPGRRTEGAWRDQIRASEHDLQPVALDALVVTAAAVEPASTHPPGDSAERRALSRVLPSYLARTVRRFMAR